MQKKIAATAEKRKVSAAAFFAAEKRRPDNLLRGILLHKGFLIHIRFRGRFSDEIFINLS